MSEINRYNPNTHEGHLPVRVLSFNVVDWFENVSPGFLEMAKYEIGPNGLDPGIAYHIDDEPIREVSQIDVKRKIHVYENFNQYLWSICYALLVLHENVVHIPENIAQGRYSATHNAHQAVNAIQVFDAGLDLLKKYHVNKFYKLPNPERYKSEFAVDIERANALYVAGMVFILTHEFAHQFYGHLMTRSGISDKERKGEEILADDFAFDQIKSSFSGDEAQTNKCGIIAALASIIFLDNSLLGGAEHPDPDDRIRNQLHKMKLSDHDDIWGFAGLVFFLWMAHYHPGQEHLNEFSNNREFCNEMLSHASNMKKKSL